MRAAGVATVAVAVLVAGCGGGSSSNGEASKTPKQVVADAQQAISAASSVHVAGKISEGGTALGLDLSMVRGKGATGNLSEGGLSFDLVRIGNIAYVRGSDAFYKKFAGAAVAQLLHGKWLKGPTSTGDFASLAPLTDMKQFFSQLTGSHGTLKNEGETSFKGQKAVAIKDTTKGGTLYIAATGKPLPLGIVGGGSNTGTVTFGDWNKDVTLKAPSGAIDLAKLGSG